MSKKVKLDKLMAKKEEGWGEEKGSYHKIPKLSPGAYIFQRPFWRELSTEQNLHFQIDWPSLIVGSEFTVFALFYFEGNFPSTSPRGGLYLEGRFNRGFFKLPVWSLYMDGLIFGILWYFIFSCSHSALVSHSFAAHPHACPRFSSTHSMVSLKKNKRLFAI